MSGGAVWRDDPLASLKEDELGTAHIARKAAGLIAETHSYESSTVISLVGPWGSGKSSIATMCCEVLEQEYPEWAIGRFTPWATSDAYTMMEDFYTALAGALPEDKRKGMRQKLGKLVRAGTPALKLIPYAGETLSETVEQAAQKLLEQPSWADAFEEASSRLSELRTPVLIVVDDVDRLQRAELVNLLRVVRLLGRFPGVSYLLAYDEQTLFANLERAQLGASTREDARLFMEKVVQYPITVPPLLESQVLQLLDLGLLDVFEDLGRSVSEHDKRLNHLLDVFLSQLRTPRSIHRFLAQVRFTLSMHDAGEVDDVDVVMLTLLRMQFPDLYAALPRWKPELTGSGMSRRLLKRADQEPDFDPLWSCIDEGPNRDDAIKVAKALFPRTEKPLSEVQRQGVANGEYFDRYFVHTVPAYDIPDAEVRRALEEASKPGADHARLSQLLTTEYVGRVELAVRRLHAITPEVVADGSVVHLLGAVLELWGKAPTGHGQLADPRDRMRWWATELLRRLPGNTPADSLKKAFARCSEPNGALMVLRGVSDEVEIPAVVTEVARDLAERALKEVIAHLQLGDEALTDESVGVQLNFIRRFGNVPAAARRIQELLDQGMSAETLASRFVSTGYMVGSKQPQWMLVDFDQESFAKFAPVEADLYQTSIVPDLDLQDLSWENRRAYTRGRAQPPAIP